MRAGNEAHTATCKYHSKNLPDYDEPDAGPVSPTYAAFEDPDSGRPRDAEAMHLGAGSYDDYAVPNALDGFSGRNIEYESVHEADNRCKDIRWHLWSKSEFTWWFCFDVFTRYAIPSKRLQRTLTFT